MQVYVIITIVMHLLLTLGSIVPWTVVKNSQPEKLPMLMFLMIGVRFVMALALYVVALCGLRGDAQAIKLFTVIYLAMYMLMLVIDTVYFYRSSKRMQKCSD